MDSNYETDAEEGLALDSANNCIQRALDGNSGAGINAASMKEMMFVTANPLSELIWSPHKGLSLKCADFSVSEKNHSFLRGIGSKNMILAPHEVSTSKGTNNDEPQSDGNFLSTQMASEFDSEVYERITSVWSPENISGIIAINGPTAHGHNLGSGGTNKESDAEMELSVEDIDLHAENRSSEKGKGLHCANNIQTNETSGVGGNTISSFQAETSMPDLEDVNLVDSSKMDQQIFDLSRLETVCAIPNEGTSSNPSENSIDVGMSKNSIKPTNALTNYLPLVTTPVKNPGGEQHELATENNLCLNDEGSEEGRNVVSESQHSDESKYSTEQNKGEFPKDQVSPGEASPYYSGVCLRLLESKARSLSDEENGRTKRNDDTNESVESCNSAGSCKIEKRPRSFEPKLVVSNKKLKKETIKNLGSASFERPNSSFMSWISNMIGRLPKPDPVEKSSLALTVRPLHEHPSRGQKCMPCQKNPDPECTSMGFHAIFQSLYIPRERRQDSGTWNLDHQEERMQDSRTWNLDHQEEGLKELDLANMIRDKSTTPISCDEENKKLCEHLPISNEKFNQGTSGSAGPSTLPNMYTPQLAVQASHKASNPTVNNKLHACTSEEGAPGLSNVPLWNDSKSPSGGKEPYGIMEQNKFPMSEANRGSLFVSAWISRFSPQASVPLSSSPQCKHNGCETNEGSSGCVELQPQPQNCAISAKQQNSLEDCKDPSAENPMDIIEKMQNYAVNISTSLGLESRKRHNYQKGTSKLNPIFPSKIFKSSEDMASVFARRLDALRNIIPSVVEKCTVPESTICLFCGKKGHNLRECSEIVESELENLLSSIGPDDGSEDSCLCIRCFQLNHWANSCPNVPFRRETHSYNNASMVNFGSFGKMQPNPSDNTHEGEAHLIRMNMNKKVDEMKVHIGQLSGLKMLKNYSPGKNLFGNMEEQRASTEYVLKGKQNASSSQENDYKENRVVTPLCDSVTRNIPDVPRGTFEAIKMLRLSRMDILKWTASSSSTSRLDGFFLRLRLGKWEEGLGRTCYHAACINGTLTEKSSRSSRISLSVTIGGFRCSIESRYVSNHDFTEDELLAWWFAMSNAGEKLPSLDDLKMKLEEKEKLGI